MHDIHSHVLFGIDDGAETAGDSVELCRMAADDGVERIVATPHIRDPVWPNDRRTIEGRLEDVRRELRRAGVGIEVVLGSEIYFASGIVEAVVEGAYPTYGDRRRYALFELPSFFVGSLVEEVVFGFRSAGITPVLAHPERNQQLMADPDLIAQLVRMGTVLQVTAMSVTGGFGRGARRAAELLLEQGQAHVVASDAHHARFRPTGLGEARGLIAGRHGEEYAALLCVENPRRVIDGEEILEPEPATGASGGGRLRSLLQRWLG